MRIFLDKNIYETSTSGQELKTSFYRVMTELAGPTVSGSILLNYWHGPYTDPEKQMEQVSPFLKFLFYMLCSFWTPLRT